MNLISGNSIAAGKYSSTPAKSWGALFSAAIGKTFTNVGSDGHMVPDQAGLVYANPLGPGDIGAIFLGTNDDRAYGDEPTKRQMFIDGLRALLVYQAANRKSVRSTDVTLVSGDWYQNIYNTHGLGIAASVPGSKCTFNLNGPVLYVSSVRQATNLGAIKLMNGATDLGTTTLGGVSGSYTKPTGSNYDYGPKCIRVGGLGSGSKTISLEVPADRGYFDWYADATPHAHVFVANIPKARLYQSGGSDTSVTNTNAAISAMVAELAADGLSVHLVDVCSVLTLSDMDADYHPIDSGHQKIADAFKAAYDVVFPPPEFTFTEDKVFKRTGGGVVQFYVGQGADQRQIATVAP